MPVGQGSRERGAVRDGRGGRGRRRRPYSVQRIAVSNRRSAEGGDDDAIDGDIPILSFRCEPSGDDGAPLTPWKATSVYRREDDGEWRIVHGHWSMMKEG